MIRVSCGRGDNRPRAEQIRGGGPKAIDRACPKKCDLIRAHAPIDRRDCRGSIAVIKVGGRMVPCRPCRASEQSGALLLSRNDSRFRA
jgi:hypothetical protein